MAAIRVYRSAIFDHFNHMRVNDKSTSVERDEWINECARDGFIILGIHPLGEGLHLVVMSGSENIPNKENDQ